MKYYSPKGPITPGSYPEPEGNSILAIVNFDELTYCPEAGRDCWGYIEYALFLTEKEAFDHGLVHEFCLDFTQRYGPCHWKGADHMKHVCITYHMTRPGEGAETCVTLAMTPLRAKAVLDGESTPVLDAVLSLLAFLQGYDSAAFICADEADLHSKF